MSLEQTIGNLEIRYANVVTFVGTSNTMVDTTTGRIQTKGFQHNSNVITDISGPHGRVAPTLKKYPEIIFEEGKFDSNDTTNTYVQSGYTATASTTYSTHRAFKAFNGVPNDFFHWQSGSFSNSDGTYSGGTQSFESTPGEWLKIEVPNKIKPASINLYRRDFDGQSPKDFKIYASITGSSWTLLTEQTGIDNWTNSAKSYNFDTGIYYKYFAILVTKITRTNSAGAQTSGTLGELELYGYEEYTPAGDHSVDTTFMSRFNNPQLTGVKVLVDGGMANPGTNQISGGADPSGNNSIYDATNKYYTLNGTLTSNLSVESNTFLEGDQPHAVSMWFNSSNLEANVSNTCVFSIASEEKLDSVNLDLQSNTWHNLTYTYQGEGGSRVTYLDGRKVAEDQAEDTFGEYPPFAMTGYAQGGYVVSASTEYNTDYLAHEAFNGTFADNGDCWLSGNLSNYNGAGGDYSGSANLGSDSGGTAFAAADRGEWLKLEMPHKFVLDYITICGSTSTTINPKNWKIYGSNDDKNWDVLLSKTNAVTVAYNATSGKEHTVGATKAYKYFALVVTKTNGFIYYTQVGELDFYGHRENDLVRLPDPTNVLKYPHVAMAGYAHRGYAASADDENGIYTVWKAFDNNFWVSGADLERWQPATGVYGTGGADTTGGGTTTLADTSIKRGNYIQLESPHKLNVTKYKIYSSTQTTDFRPKKVILLGSNTGGTDWVSIDPAGEVVLPTYSGSLAGLHTTVSFSNTSAYKYHRLVIRATHAGVVPIIFQFQLFGTEEGSVPIQIGGGNIDKVANFRVYDKFVGEDQALEIWDAQKDYFGRAKSQMVLQQGKLGVGTDAPQGRFSVADEPHNLEEFPPRAGGFDGDEWYIEGHGTFKACTSSYHDNRNYYPGRAFTKSLVVNFGFATLSDGTVARWSGNGGLPNQSSSDPVGTFQGHQGDWLELELPYRIRVKSFQIQTRIATYSPGDHPKNGFLYGSNNRENWTQITEFTNLSYTPSQLDGIGAHKAIWNINSETGFKYLRLLTTQKIDGSDAWLMISELKYFGTREQGQSVLHDGQLTLTKSLNVPRIGPPLDVDDTPRRDRLAVEYNTPTNPTFEGAVLDTSGRGLDAILRDATYNATEKSFRVGSSQDIFLAQGIPGKSGDITNVSYSIWFKADSVSSQVQVIMSQISAYAANVGLNLILNYNDLQIGIGGLYSSSAAVGGVAVNAISAGQWYHIVAIKKGIGVINSTTFDDIFEMYINGKKKTLTHGGGTATLNMGVNHWLIIGAIRDVHTTTEEFVGDVSSIKYYDTALTAEEAKTLYDMGRCDEGHHVVNFSKTRVGIGLGDGEAPRGALDVRGDIYGGCPVFFHARRTTHAETSASTGFDPLIWQSTFNNKGGGYSTTTGKFTAPIAGFYEFFYGGMTLLINERLEMIPKLNNVVYPGPTIFISPDNNQQHRYAMATAIVEMKMGDTWHIQIPANGAGGMYGTGYSYNMFTGKLLSTVGGSGGGGGY